MTKSYELNLNVIIILKTGFSSFEKKDWVSARIFQSDEILIMLLLKKLK